MYKPTDSGVSPQRDLNGFDVGRGGHGLRMERMGVYRGRRAVLFWVQGTSFEIVLISHGGLRSSYAFRLPGLWRSVSAPD